MPAPDPMVGTEWLAQHLDAAHPRHALIDDEQRDGLVANLEVAEHAQRLGSGERTHDAVVASITPADVAHDRSEHRGFVVNREYDWFFH